jgi:uncharacterized protein GlcG (DUF336 family)
MGDLSIVDARALVRRAVDKAEQLGLRGGIAVVGASGALVTASRLDNGGPGGMARARSKAWIAATQQKRAHAREIQETAAAHALRRAEIDDRAAAFGAFETIVRPGTSGA